MTERKTIGALAAAASVTVETVRYYQRIGLLREPAKPKSGTRTYEDGDVARLRFIRRAKPLGFSLDEIGELLALRGSGGCPRTLELLASRLLVVRRRIQELKSLESDLEALAEKCSSADISEVCPALHVFQS